MNKLMWRLPSQTEFASRVHAEPVANLRLPNFLTIYLNIFHIYIFIRITFFRFSLAVAYVKINESNDHPPAFPQSLYEAAVYEAAAVGTLVAKVQVRKSDILKLCGISYQSNSQYQYAIMVVCIKWVQL